jgi:hypothetical protein
MRSLWLAAVAASALAAGGAANAAIVTLTFGGAAFVGDTGGFFGAPGASHNGDPFTVVAKFDDAGAAGQGGGKLVAGGTDLGLPDPALLVTLTIGSGTYDFAGSNAFVFLQSERLLDSTLNPGSTRGFVDHIEIQVLGAAGSLFLQLDGFNDPIVDGVMTIPDSGLSFGDARLSNGEGVGFRIAFATADHIDPLAIPEPATWVLLLAGFGGAGAMLRRCRAASALAPAVAAPAI